LATGFVGCDDCQLVCPWNKFAQLTTLDDFAPRNGLERATLLELFGWSAAQFDERLVGSAIRRIGYEQWLRNIAVAFGNALHSDQLAAAHRGAIIAALRRRAEDASPLVREHIDWALEDRSVGFFLKSMHRFVFEKFYVAQLTILDACCM
jgi:epoxyqueuosine reductase